MKGQAPFQGEIVTTLNLPVCIIIASLRLVYCLEMLFRWAMLAMDLLFKSLVFGQKSLFSVILLINVSSKVFQRVQINEA